MSYIVKRKSYYYFRLWVPEDIQHHFKRREITKSLRTKSFQQAIILVKPIHHKIETIFMQIRSGMMTDDQIKQIVKDHLVRTLRGNEYLRSIGVLTFLPKDGEKPPQDQCQQVSIAAYQNIIEQYSAMLFNNDFSVVRNFVYGLLERANIEVVEGSPEYTRLCREFIKSEISIKKIEIDRLNGNYNNDYDAFLTKVLTVKEVTTEPEKEVGMTLSKLIDEHVKEAQQASSWTEKSLAENESIYKVFLEILGDRSIKNITHQDLIACRNKLIKLPANRGKNAKYRDKSIDDILAMKNIAPMNLVTINKYLGRLSTLFKWATKHQYISSNYAEGLTLPTKKRASEDREPYSIEDINLIKLKLNNDHVRPERYWIPIIGMYSGMRLEEICQLHTEDIVNLDNVTCFDINENGDKKLKTESSRRVVPIHPKLIELGLIKFADSQKASGKARLWDNLKKGRDGYSHDLGKWYQKFNRKEVTTNPKRVFHSFRHLVANSLKQNGVEEVVIAEILGHAVDSMTMSRYGKKYNPKVLLEALSKLKYDSVEAVDETPLSIQAE